MSSVRYGYVAVPDTDESEDFSLQKFYTTSYYNTKNTQNYDTDRISPSFINLYNDINKEIKKHKGRNKVLLEKCLLVLKNLSNSDFSQVELIKEEIEHSKSCCETYCPSFFKSNFSKLIDITLAMQLPNNERSGLVKTDSKGYLSLKGKKHG